MSPQWSDYLRRMFGLSSTPPIDFIKQEGDPQIPPPYKFPRVSLRHFELEADYETLKRLCDKLLNSVGTAKDRGFTYQPAETFGHVDLQVLSYPHMYSECGEYAQMGYCSQHELCFKIKVFRPNRPESGVDFFMPYIFVDNAWSVVAGRDVIGYPKVMGSFSIPEANGYPIEMSTDVFRTYKIDTPLTRERVIVIDRDDTRLRSEPVPEWTWPWGAIQYERYVPELHSFVKNLREKTIARLSPAFGTIQVKQIRDPKNYQLACYQALVHGMAKTENLTWDLLDPAQITLYGFDSLRIADDLGLDAASTTNGGVILKSNQYSVLFDLRLYDTENLYVRCSRD